MPDPAVDAAISVGTIALIGVIFIIILLFNPGLVERLRNVRPGTIGAETPGFFNVSAFIGLIGAVAPDVVMFSGYVSDILAGEFKYSLLSLMGIIVAIINWLFFGAFSSISVATAASVATQPLFQGTAATVSRAAADVATGVNQIGIANPNPNPTRPPRPQRSAASINESIVGTAPTLGSLGGSNAGPAASIPKSVSFKRQAGGAVYPASVISRDPTVVRGLGFLDTQKSPMGLAILSFIFMIYLMDMSVNKKRDVGDIVLNFFTGLLIICLNMASYFVFKSYGNNTSERVWAITKATGLGGVLGIMIFYILNAYAKQYLPLDPKNGFGNKCNSPFIYDAASGDCICPPGQQRVGSTCQTMPSSKQLFTLMSEVEHFTENEKASAPMSNPDEFVCDLYQGGKKITTVNM